MATLVLVLTPATVSFPVALTEVVVLAVGLAVMLVLDFVLLRRAFAPLERLRRRDARRSIRSGRVRARRWGMPIRRSRSCARAFDEMLERLEEERRESARARSRRRRASGCGSRASCTTRSARR